MGTDEGHLPHGPAEGTTPADEPTRQDSAAGPRAGRGGDGGYRTGRGLLAGLGVLLVVAVPAATAGYLALVSFLGCLVECRGPQPGRGVMWASVTALLLAVPVVVGLVVARVPLRRGWPWVVGLAAAATAGATLLQRVA